MAPCDLSALALDMDGTLLTSDKRITPGTLATLRALLARDLQILVVTGKAPGITARCLRPLRLPMVCLDGAVHVTGAGERWVAGTTIDDSLAAWLLGASAGPCYAIADGVTLVRGPVDQTQYVDWSDRVGELAEPRLRRVTHLVFVHRDRSALAATARRVRGLAERGARSRLSLYLTEEPFRGFYNLFVRSAGCSKLRGVQAISRHLHVPLAGTMFIGDWMNDIPLLEAVRFPVAMRHAPAAVRSCARAITLYSNDEEGVSRFLRAFFAVTPPPHAREGRGRTGPARDQHGDEQGADRNRTGA